MGRVVNGFLRGRKTRHFLTPPSLNANARRPYPSGASVALACQENLNGPSRGCMGGIRGQDPGSMMLQNETVPPGSHKLFFPRRLRHSWAAAVAHSQEKAKAKRRPPVQKCLVLGTLPSALFRSVRRGLCPSGTLRTTRARRKGYPRRD